MQYIRFIGILLSLALTVSAGKPDKNRLRWEPGDGVTKRFDTPGGAVYRFTRSADMVSVSPACETKKNCNCDSCRNRYRCFPLRCNFAEHSLWKNKQWLILQFYIRSFPGAQDPHPLTDFALLASYKRTFPADYKYIDTQIYLHCENSLTYGITKNRMKGEESFSAGIFWPQPYQWTPFRIAIHLNDGKVFCFRPGFINLTRWKQYRPGSGTNAFALMVRDRDPKEDKVNTATEFEISPPAVFTTDDLEEFCRKNPLCQQEYPYGAYPPPDNYRKVIRDKNSDRIYAAALLWGNPESPWFTPAKAVKALEKAARQDHPLAAARLAAVYDWGLGVPPDFAQAAKFIKRADRLGESVGWVSHWFRRWDAMGRPWIVSPDFFIEFDRHVTSNQSWIKFRAGNPTERNTPLEGGAHYKRNQTVWQTPESIRLDGLLNHRSLIPAWHTLVNCGKSWYAPKRRQQDLRRNMPDEPRSHLPAGKMPKGEAWQALAEIVRYDEENGRVLNDEKRIRLFHELERYCRADFIPALYLIGRLYQANGDFPLHSGYFSGDPDKGRRYLERAAKLGYRPAREALNREAAPAPTDWRETFRSLRKKRLDDPEDPYCEWHLVPLVKPDEFWDEVFRKGLKASD